MARDWGGIYVCQLPFGWFSVDNMEQFQANLNGVEPTSYVMVMTFCIYKLRLTNGPMIRDRIKLLLWVNLFTFTVNGTSLFPTLRQFHFVKPESAVLSCSYILSGGMSIRGGILIFHELLLYSFNSRNEIWEDNAMWVSQIGCGWNSVNFSKSTFGKMRGHIQNALRNAGKLTVLVLGTQG